MLLKGSIIKNKIKERLKEDIVEIMSQHSTLPHLGIVMVGINPRSKVYIDQKIKFANSIGAKTTLFEYPESILPIDLCQAVEALGRDLGIHGIIVQMPLPPHFSSEDVRRVIDSIPPIKDADGLTTFNMGYLLTAHTVLAENYKGIIPATTRGIAEMISFYGIEMQGKHLVMIGKSNLVGKPTALYALQCGATVTICHSKTAGLDKIVQGADIVISATGIPKLINTSMVRDGQYLIDVGISIDGAGVLSGDIDTEQVEKIVAGISPVPGGVGPLTVSGLFLNLFDLYKRQKPNV